MGTRALIKVIEEGMETNESRTLYCQDAKPSDVVERIKKAYEMMIESYKFQEELKYPVLGYPMGYSGKVASFLCASHPKGIEPYEGKMPTDLEFFYKLYVARWDLEIFVRRDTYTRTKTRRDFRKILPRTRALDISDEQVVALENKLYKSR